MCKTERHPSHYHQGAPEDNPADNPAVLRDILFWVSVKVEHTWFLLALVGFILPVRVMSALKEISEIPPSKRRGLVRVQGWGTQPGPKGQPFPQDTVYTKAPLSPLQRRQRLKDTLWSSPPPKKKSDCNSDSR